MARSDITSRTIDVISDDGSLLISVAQGEQILLTFEFDLFASLAGCVVTAKSVEGDNIPGQRGTPPEVEAQNPVITNLPVIDDIVFDNKIQVVIPKDLADSWATQPAPNDPVYSFFSISIADSGEGNRQQTFTPTRGLIEVRYNPTVRT